MPAKRTRRHERIPCTASVRMSWADAEGFHRYGQGRCLDISEVGLRVQTPPGFKANGYLTLRIDGMDVAGTASVRYVRTRGAGLVVGLEWSQPLSRKALDTLRAAAQVNHIESSP